MDGSTAGYGGDGRGHRAWSVSAGTAVSSGDGVPVSSSFARDTALA